MFIFKSKSGKGYKIYDTDAHTYECVSQSVLDKALSLGITIVGLDREMAIQKAKVFNDMHIDTTGSMTAFKVYRKFIGVSGYYVLFSRY